MAKMHLKGHMLQLMERGGPLWDYEIADAVMTEYGLSGDYWYGTVRLTLTDLFSAGLIEEIETTVDPEKSFGAEKLLFKFALSDFGRDRMRQSGLLEATT